MYYNVYLLAAIHNISAHNVLSTMTKMSTIYIHHIHNMDSIHLDIVLIQRFMILAEYWHIDLTKNWPKIWFTWKIWKRFWLTHLTQGQDWVRGEKNIFRNPSSTKWSLYTMLFSLSVSLAPKMLKQNFMLESLRPAYTILTFQSDYSPLYARCAHCTSQVQKLKFMVNFSSVSGFCYHPSSFFYHK